MVSPCLLHTCHRSSPPASASVRRGIHQPSVTISHQPSGRWRWPPARGVRASDQSSCGKLCGRALPFYMHGLPPHASLFTRHTSQELAVTYLRRELRPPPIVPSASFAASALRAEARAISERAVRTVRPPPLPPVVPGRKSRCGEADTDGSSGMSSRARLLLRPLCCPP